jgi:hypothetical protein
MKKSNPILVTRTTTTIMLALAAILTMSVLNNDSLSTIIPAFACGKDHNDGDSDHDGKPHKCRGSDHDGKPHKSRGSDQIPTVVTIPLEGLSLNKQQFLLLSDTTPVRVGAAHLALNVPCTEDEETGEIDSDIIAVAGVAPDVQTVELELVPELSSPPNNCLFHGDIPNNSDEVTDIAIANAGDVDIQFLSGNFATLAITDVNTFNFGPMYHPDINP